MARAYDVTADINGRFVFRVEAASPSEAAHKVADLLESHSAIMRADYEINPHEDMTRVK